MLLNLKTDLKSLKYGKDRPGGGDSGQPYIQSDINSNPQTVRVNDDGRIRGGARGAENASTTDLLRIKRFINSKPKGNLFLTNQIGLQFSNPRLETRKISLGNGTGILGFINRAVNAISSNFGPTRIYNLGINTLAQVPVTAYGIHFNRHGLLPAQDDNTKYFAVVTNNNENGNNRLESLQTKFQLGVKYSNTNFIDNPLITRTQRLLRTLNPIARSIGGLIGGRVGRAINNVSRLSSLFFNNNDLTIDNYLGGPGSTYGVGKTLIKRYDITENGQRIDSAFEKSNTVARNAKVRWDISAGLSQKGPSISTGDDGTYNIIDPSVENQNSIQGLNAISPTAKTYKQLRNTIDNLPSLTPKTIPFSTVNNINFKPTGFGPFKNKEFKNETNSGLDRTPSSPFRYYGKAKSSLDGSQLVYDNSNTYSRIDSDILTNVFTIIDPFSGNEDKIFLSSYMKGFKEDFTATWNDVNYAGRAESFYVYNKFKRNVSFNLQIPCFNRKELFEKHRALGQLASTTAGSYNNGFLGGVLIKLNIGNYIVGEYSILNSLNYSIPDDASWDITPEGRLAMLIDTSFNFTIIHKELPQYKSQQGFFNYLPDQVSGYLLKGNRTQTEQSKINSTFSNENYEKYASGDTKTPTPVIRLNPNDIPLTSQSPFRPTIDTTIKTPDTLKSIDLRTGKTPNQLRGYVDNPINNPTLPTSQTPFA
jgi:hypothetical protein